VAEATADVVAQAVVAAVVAISIRAGGVVEIVEALNHRVIYPLAMIRTTELRNQGQRATSVRKRDTGSRIASDI
jgi:hypothetical protein